MKILSKKGFIYSFLVLTMLVWNSGFSGLLFSTVKAEEEVDSLEMVAPTKSIVKVVEEVTPTEPVVEEVTPSELGSSEAGNSSVATVLRSNICGDGYFVIDGPEQCDDGNIIDGDGCSANCVLETRYSCENVTAQNGWYGEYYNYSRNHPDMNLSSLIWPDNGHGDPLGDTWNTDWYSENYFRFNRVDNSLTFGNNWFPFDMAKEQNDIGHEYHFGAHWRAQVTVSTPGNYNFNLTSDDDSWVYVDGQLVGDNKGIHATKTINGAMSLLNTHIVDVFFAERHTTGSYMSFAFTDQGVQINPMPEECEQPIKTYPGPFCSVLFGLIQKDYYVSSANLEVLDMAIDQTGSINLSDLSQLGAWYSNGDNTACQNQVEKNLTCTNWEEYDWCNGLLQGIKDSYYSQAGDPEYWAYFDLNDDGYINLSDESIIGGWITANAQQTCYNRLVPPLMSLDRCQEPTCGDGQINQDWEVCDTNEEVDCTTEIGNYAGTKTCFIPSLDGPQILMTEVVGPICVWNPCITEESCGDYKKNGNEECDTRDGIGAHQICSLDCILVDLPYCGDGVVNGQEEQCDGSAGVTTGYHCDGTCHLVQNGLLTPPAPTSGGGGGGYSAPGPSGISSGPQCVLASISWVTSQASISWIVYGSSSNNYTAEYKDTVKKVGHTLVLTNLLPGTTYYYRVKMQNADGSVVTSDEKSFTTKTNCPLVPQVLGEKITESQGGAICKYTRPDGLTTEDKDIIQVFNFANGTLIRGICDSRYNVYLIKDQKKWLVPNWKYLWQHHFGQRIFNVPQSVIESYPSVK